MADRARGLIERLQADGGTLRWESPSEGDRAMYGRLIHACKQHDLVPAGFELLYTGRDRGDLVVRLSQGSEKDKTEWDRIRLDARRVTSDPGLLAQELEQNPACLRVSEKRLPRALRLVRALAVEARRGGYRLGVNTKLKTPKLFLQAGQVRREVTIEEEYDQVPHVVTDEDRRALRRASWRPPPAFDSVASGRLRLKVARAGWDKHDTWVDEEGARLEKRLGDIICDVRAGLEADEQARVEAERQAEAQAARRQREEEEKHARWRAAVAEARVHAAETLRRETFRGAYEAWLGAGEIRAFCAALETTAQDTSADERANLTLWIGWARDAADRMDPTLEPAVLAGVSFEVEPGPDDLRPFLGEWSPHRPEQDYSRTTTLASTPSIADRVEPRPWHPGMRGRPTWWRR